MTAPRRGLVSLHDDSSAPGSPLRRGDAGGHLELDELRGDYHWTHRARGSLLGECASETAAALHSSSASVVRMEKKENVFVVDVDDDDE